MADSSFGWTLRQYWRQNIWMKYILLLLAPILFFSACSSAPPQPTGPAWTQQPVRSVDNGYIIYVDSDEAAHGDKAQYKAEGLALQDLANECSFIPKGTRIEDRYTEQTKYGYKAYAKLAVEFQECDEAQKTNNPSEIKKIANISFTQQLKGYQDLLETGMQPDKTADQEINPNLEIPPAPVQTEHETSSIHFYAMRQYAAYQNEIVILSPPTAYAPSSVETKKYIGTMQPVNAQIQQLQMQNPALKTAPIPWSQLADRPTIKKPKSLAPKAGAPKPFQEKSQTAKNYKAWPNSNGKKGVHRHRQKKEE